MKQTLLASAWLIVAACSASQSSAGTRAPSPEPTRGSPAWIVEQYFVRPSFPDRRDYLFDELADEVDGPTIGAELPAGAEVTYRPIQLLADAAVFAVTIRNRGQVEDWYAFLASRGSEWRMGEIRALALPRFFYMLMDSLTAKPVLPDSEAAMLANMRLVTNSDSALRGYFVAHRAALTRLASAFLESGVTKALAYEGRRASNTTPPALAAELRTLSLDAIERDEEQSGCIRLVIGGMLDNVVGYLYAPAGCTPPQRCHRMTSSCWSRLRRTGICTRPPSVAVGHLTRACSGRAALAADGPLFGRCSLPCLRLCSRSGTLTCGRRPAAEEPVVSPCTTSRLTLIT